MSFKNYYLGLIYRMKDLVQDNNPRKEMIKLRTRLRLNYTDFQPKNEEEDKVNKS
jgi:hypothetical protein